MFSPTKMIFFLHLFPVLRIIFNVRVQSTFVRRKSLLKKENKEKNYVDNNQCIFKDHVSAIKLINNLKEVFCEHLTLFKFILIGR